MERANKKTIINKHQKHQKDTGSAAVQVAILSHKIAALSEHLQIHKKDDHSRRGLIQMVSKRRKLLDYLSNTKPEEYKSLISHKELKIRK
jgi:small subunit ribosomal protein S15